MKSFAALTFLLALATASPVEVVPREEGSLEKRDTEIIYLSNCKRTVSCCPPLAETHSSAILVGSLRVPNYLTLLTGVPVRASGKGESERAVATDRKT
jgi:hypothetical protein